MPGCTARLATRPGVFSPSLACRRDRGTIVFVSDVVKVTCEGTKKRGTHEPRIVAYYAWSESDDVWERIDRHGSDRDWFISGSTATTLVAFPTPRLKCSCGYDPQPSHDELQERLTGAKAEGVLTL